MPIDMKRTIAEAVQVLLIERHVKKLTVKDIVEQCHITRQAFYYHFEGIPELLQWMIDGYFEKMMTQTMAQEDDEAGLRCFFVMAVNAAPYVEQGMRSNYGEDLRRLLRQAFQRYFALASQRKNFCPRCTHTLSGVTEMDDIELKVKKIVAEQLGIKEEDIKNESSFIEDLGADSLTTVEMSLALEDAFGIEIPDTEQENLRTVQQAIDYVKSAVNK